MNRPNKLPPPDIYPGLDDELDAVYERNVSQGIAVPVEKAPEAELGAVVVEQLQQAAPEALPEEIKQWAVSQLMPANEKWARLRTHLEFPLPAPLSELADKHPNFRAVINRLHDAQEVLTGSGEKTPEGLPIGETMKLALIPWQDLRNSIGNGVLQEWLKGVRKSQGIDEEDYINDDLIDAIQTNKPLYRNPDKPGELMTPKDYLDRKIAEDGAWGIMLVQTSEQAGVESLRGKSPDELTSDGQGSFAIGAKCRVDGLGIFEWLALTIQEDPRQLSAKTDYSWMLANRLDVEGDPYVPNGYWLVDQVGSGLASAADQDDNMRPRLAVL